MRSARGEFDARFRSFGVNVKPMDTMSSARPRRNAAFVPSVAATVSGRCAAEGRRGDGQDREGQGDAICTYVVWCRCGDGAVPDPQRSRRRCAERLRLCCEEQEEA